MCNPYEVIKAATAEEALEKSKWSIGDQAEVADVKAVSGCSHPTNYTVIPVFKKTGMGEPHKCEGCGFSIAPDKRFCGECVCEPD